jgi:hypothetical protein
VIRRTIQALFIITRICCTSTFAQDKAAHDRLLAARALYYTPVARGLKSFHCEARIDWKALLTRIGGTEIPDDNPVVKYLNAIHLSVEDQLNGKGALEWTETGVPPEGQEAGVRQMRDGFQTMMTGFFQTWNGYMNGSMVPLPDSKVTVTTAEAGVHLSGTSGSTRFDEDFDKNMLLTQALVVNPEIKVLATPTYVNTPEGLLISAVTSQINQPPSAPPAETTIRIQYAKVGAFQLPSNVILDTRNVGVFEVSFNSCQVSVSEVAPKPTAEKSGQIN